MDIYQKLQRHPDLLYRIVQDPDYHLNTRQPSALERRVFFSLKMQAYGRVAYSRASRNRKRTYRNHLSALERDAMKQEQWVFRNTVLQGYEIYRKVAERLNYKYHNITPRQAKTILESASEVIANLEVLNFGRKNAA